MLLRPAFPVSVGPVQFPTLPSIHSASVRANGPPFSDESIGLLKALWPGRSYYGYKCGEEGHISSSCPKIKFVNTFHQESSSEEALEEKNLNDS